MNDKPNFQNNVPMSQFTTLKVGGEARQFVSATSDSELIEVVKYADENLIPLFVLGGGSNIFVSDQGFDGIVVHVRTIGIKAHHRQNDEYTVSAKAGEDWDAFVEFCVSKDLAGVECLSGIPGYVGGTPIQNVGAYGQEVSESIERVEVYDRILRQTRFLSNEECGFSYRRSIFNSNSKNRFVVISVEYNLQKNGSPKLAYSELIDRFKDESPSLKTFRHAVCEIRRSKGMLVRQGGADSQSAGSFFKNPIVSLSQFQRLERNIREKKLLDETQKIPHYAIDDNGIKIPAAWLIEMAGFEKGYRCGNAGLSTRHTLALTNRGHATSDELMTLKNKIQKKVRESFGIDLLPEPIFVGF